MNSLRARLILSHAAIAVVALLTAGAVLAVLFRSYQIQLAQSRLDDLAIPLSLQLRERWRSQTPAEISEFLREQSDALGIRILFVTVRGRVVADTAAQDNLVGEFLAMPPPAGASDAGQLPRFSFATRDRQRYHAVLVPARNLAPAPGERQGIAAMALAVSENRLPSPWTQLGRRLGFAALVSLGIGSLLALALARWIHAPLAQLLETANALERGDYDRRAAATGPREVAELARAFNRMATEVARSQQVLREFVANVSHELRTPLTAVRGFVQGMRDGVIVDEAERAGALALIDRETRRLQGLVAELLDLSRLEARQVSFHFAPVDLSELGAQCREIFALRAEEQGVELVKDVPDGLRVTADADRLEQVLTNLIDNALAHTPSGGRVAIRARHDGNGAVEVSVEDTGPGIPAMEIPRVFERFYRGNTSRGSGLGLAIAREIVVGHGGDIRVTSAPNEGTRFTIWLPQVKT